MTDIKTYWGLTEIELNKFWKLMDKNKDLNNVYLSLEVKIENDDTYDYYKNKVKENYNDFEDDMVYTVNQHLCNFKEQNELNEYNEYYNKI